MCETIRHRGPDEGGAERVDDCVLGVRRLSIIDLQTGSQPVANENGDVVAVFNGEIYNFQQLRDELAAQGHEVAGTGDTPILPHLYEQYGPRFVERLDGMFALALYDRPRRRLVLARDRLGKKPLLWTRLPDGSLAWASELKALLTLPGVSRELDLPALDAYLSLQYVPAPATGLRGVHKLPPGHLLVAEDGGEPRVERWWEPTPVTESHSEEEWLERVRDTVGEAVRRRLVADVPLGALLSGGIDSSIVVALMAEASAEPVRTFSVGFTDERYDERRYARLVAERYGTRHEELLVEPDAAELLVRVARTWDEPFGDSSALPTAIVCEHARRHVTVALTGDGGDEAFAGYERYRAVGLAGALDRFPAALPRAAARSLRLLPAARREPRSPFFRAARFLEAAGAPPATRYGRLMEVLPATLRRGLWTDEALAEIGSPPPASALLGPPPAPGLTGLQLLDLRTYLPGDLLVKADLASMASSLELRSPFLDHHVVELALGLPDALKVSGQHGKVALRRAFAASLPDEILARGKKGFGVPVSRWFREELRVPARDLLLDDTARARGLFRPAAVESLLAAHVSGRADHGAQLWSLLMLELWQRVHIESADPTAAAAALPLAARA